jgi:hypothetical protein
MYFYRFALFAVGFLYKDYRYIGLLSLKKQEMFLPGEQEWKD